MNNYHTAVTILLLVFVHTASASDMYAYPKQGQSAEQQSRDDYDCFRWASQRTGYDPQRPTSTSNQTSGSTGRGVLRGALVGAAIGEIADNKGGEGAAIGGLLGGMRGHRSGQQQAQAAAAGERNAYNRAYKACMEGRGYSVN